MFVCPDSQKEAEKGVQRDHFPWGGAFSFLFLSLMSACTLYQKKRKKK